MKLRVVECGFTSNRRVEERLHRCGDQEISQFRGAELIAERWNLSREEMEQFALTSHERGRGRRRWRSKRTG